MRPEDNLGDPAIANVKGDKRSKFSVSNFAAYSNTKAPMDNAGEKGHIFKGKYKPLTPEDIMKVMEVYILNELTPSLQLVQKMQLQSKDRTHGNNFIAKHVGPGYQQLHRSYSLNKCQKFGTYYFV